MTDVELERKVLQIAGQVATTMNGVAEMCEQLLAIDDPAIRLGAVLAAREGLERARAVVRGTTADENLDRFHSLLEAVNQSPELAEPFRLLSEQVDRTPDSLERVFLIDRMLYLASEIFESSKRTVDSKLGTILEEVTAALQRLQPECGE